MTTNPKLEASRLINDYALKSAALEAATADIKAELAALTAMLNKASAPHAAELEKIEAEANALALAHGAAIFGKESRSLTQNGFILQVRSSHAVVCEDEASAMRELLHLSRNAKTQEAQIAALACLRTKTELDKDYITKHYDNHREWFNVFGLEVVERETASLKPAPKVKAKKATQKKAQAEEKEAA